MRYLRVLYWHTCIYMYLFVCVCALESWCGDYCPLLVVSTCIIVLSVVTLSVYLITSRHRHRRDSSCCLTSKRHDVRSGVSAEYAFASALPLEYRPPASSDSAVLHAGTSAPPGDWYQQQLTALLQASNVSLCHVMLSRADPGLMQWGGVWNFFWIFIPKWRGFVHSANDGGHVVNTQHCSSLSSSCYVRDSWQSSVWVWESCHRSLLKPAKVLTQSPKQLG